MTADDYENKMLAIGAGALVLIAALFVTIVIATRGRISPTDCEKLCGAGNVEKFDTTACTCRTRTAEKP